MKKVFYAKNRTSEGIVKKYFSLKSLRSVVILIVFFCNSFSSRAQWNSVNTGSTKDMYSVDYFSANDIWIGAANSLVKTGNNGANWTIVDPLVDNFTAPIPGGIYDLALTSSTTAIATGLFYLGNVECVLQTTNGGVSWTRTHENQTGPLLRYMPSVDNRGSVFIAVGNTGRIARSTNSGASWTIVPSGTTNLLNDVKFVSTNTVIAVGENVILKSTDAGLTWTPTTRTGDFQSLSCPPNCIYFGDYYSDSLFKSTNNGQSFTAIHLPFENRGVIHAVSTDTILASGVDGLYVSFDGGTGWEKYNLNPYHLINMLDFINSSDGIAVGDSGYVIRTTNLSSIPSFPITSFSIPGGTSYCQNDILNIVNTTAQLPGYTYSWKMDSMQLSTQYNVSLVLPNSGNHTVSLTVTNQYGSTTTSQQITVVGHELQPFFLQGTPGTVCSGNLAILTIPNSQTGANYRLRNGFTNIGNIQNGNGDTLTFISSAGISSPTVFNVIGVRTNMCYTDSIVNYVTISSATGGPKSACIPSSGNNSNGITNVSFNTINNSSPGNAGYYNNYACLANTNVIVGNSYPLSITTNLGGNVAVWIDYDTSGTFLAANEFIFSGHTTGTSITQSITIPASFHMFNVPLRMRIGLDPTTFSSSDWCGVTFGNGEYEDYSITIVNAPVAPTAAFTYTTATTCSTNVTFSNNTFNANNYLWDFGDGDTSTSFRPVHIYTSSGTFIAQLIASNSFGADTLTQTIVIQNPSVPVTAVCNPALAIPSCDHILISGVQVQGPGTTGFFNVSPGSGFSGDFTCTKQVKLLADSLYQLAFQLRIQGSTNCSGTSCVWVDWNNDGTFDDTAPERIVNGNIGGCPTVWIGLHVPTSAVKNVPLRARILSDDNNVFSSCATICGQVVEFTIIVRTSLIAADFNASTTQACLPATVSFTNTSINAVTSRWDFGDGSTSTLQNPTHIYTTPGIFSVKLVACNSSGDCDSLFRTSYINIGLVNFANNVSICNGQSYTVGTHVYNSAGIYVDTLTTSSGCDSIVTTNLTMAPGPNVSISPSTYCRGDSVILTASAGLSSWQWYKWISPIPSATDSIYVAKEHGYFWCVGYNSALCSSSSNLIYVTIPCQVVIPGNGNGKHGSLENNFDDINIFPNPSSGLITMQSPGGEMKIYSFTGLLVYSRQINVGTNQFDLSDFSDGFYFITLQVGSTTLFKSLVLSKH